MHSFDQMMGELHVIEEQMWNLGEDFGFSRLETKISDMLAQVAVHRMLANTVRWLQDPSENREKRLRGFMKAYGTKETSRWETLRSLSCEILLFVAASYNSVDIDKLSKIDFKFLIDMAPQYLIKKDLPRDWMYRKPFQVAIASNSELKDVAPFKRKYHALEEEGLENQKRPRIGDKQPRIVDSEHTGTGKGIQMAFSVAPEDWNKIYLDICEERGSSGLAGDSQSIILTVPQEDRVGAIVHSIPRQMAMECSKKYDLTEIPF